MGENLLALNHLSVYELKNKIDTLETTAIVT
jgi:hypothetical protein